LTGSLYDHLLAVILMGAIFAAAVAALPNIGYVSLLSVDQQQLRNVALSALNTMLLDAGYPIDWGNGVSFSPASVVRFGLASTSDSGLYTLDTDKVMRLVERDEWGRPNPIGYLPAERARQLLRLQNYGFNLTILAPFKAVVRDLSPPRDPSNPTDQELQTISYEVTVKLNDGKPVPNAVASALIVYSVKVSGTGPDEQYDIGSVRETQTTDELGKCKIMKSLSGQISDIVMILKVTVANINTVTTVYGRSGGPRNDIAYINVVGDNIILTTPPAVPRDNRWILNIVACTEEGMLLLYKGTQSDVINWGSSEKWLKNIPGLEHLNPMLMLFNFRAVEKNSGRQGILVVGPFPGYLGSRVLSYSCGRPQGETVTLQRVVIIAGMTYTVEFTLWKQ